MKDKNLVERYDDNPGAYFSMLVESVEDKEDKKELKEDHISSWKDALHKNYVSDFSGKTYPSTVEEASKKEIKWFKSKVENFRKAHDEFLDALYEIKTFDSSDVLVGGYVDENETPYPFDLSFDETGMGLWLRSVEENCDALYEEALNESLKESKSGAKEIAKEIAKQFGINPKIVSTKLGYYRIPTKMLFGDFIEKAKDNGFINTGKKNIFHKDINGATVSVEFDEKNSAIYIDFKYKKDASLKEQKEVTREEKIKAISSNPEARKMAQKLTDQGELSLDAIISFVYADFFGKEESLKEDKNELSIVGEFETGENFGQSAGTSKKNQAIFRAKALMKMKGLSRAKVINAKGNVVWDSDTMLKENKFVPQAKMSKKAQKELNDKKRGTWGNTNPVTKVQPNKKTYDRKRDKKVVDEALNIGYWSADSWGSDYPPDNWEEIVSRANEMIKNKYLQTRDEEETRDYSSRLWDGYCRRARQLEKQRGKKATNEAKESFSSLSKLADRVEQLKNVYSAYEDNGIIKIKCKWRKSEKQARNDHIDVNASLKKLLGDKKYKLVFEKIDSRDGGKEFSAILSLTTSI